MKNKPSKEEFLRGIAEFRKHEKRDAMYKVAIRIVKDYWGKWNQVADGLGVLLLTWNQALYRYGMFDFDRLEQFLKKRQNELNEFKDRKIDSLNSDDDKLIKNIFNELLVALTSIGKDKKLRKSPVAVAKALHMIAPNFFPIWDNAIAKAYDCYWMDSTEASMKYYDFCLKIKEVAEYVETEM